jgi:chorismate synthase
MWSNTFGQSFKVTSFGESHGPVMGVVIDGLNPGILLGPEDIQDLLDRRKPGIGPFSSSRREPDKARIVSGVFEGKTTGTPLCILIDNKDSHSADYEKLKNLFRPGHADYTWWKKYGIRDYRGGGRSSGRETVSRVAAGAVARKLLAEEGIEFLSFSHAIGGISWENFSVREIKNNSLACPDRKMYEQAAAKLTRAKKNKDSLGGIAGLIIKNLPPGLGDPVFHKLDARLSFALLSIGGVKGIEFGQGFEATSMSGSEHNDQMDGSGFLSNNAGGITGGISTGQDILIRVAVKPVSSIGHPQKTVDKEGNEIELQLEGRHDTCLLPRILPVMEAMAAIVLADAKLIQGATGNCQRQIYDYRYELELLDSELLELLARRSQLAKAVGMYKEAEGLPVLDSSREKELEKKWLEMAQILGENSDYIKKIFNLVVKNSRQIQKNLKES